MKMYTNYRICKSIAGETVYEQHKSCRCESCNRRLKMEGRPPNQATTTTANISQIENAENFLKNWTCQDKTKQPNTLVYIGKYPERVAATIYYYQF